jgi:DNA-binding response OmpR family regulator
MTGFADQRERAHGLETLIYDVVPKPFSLQVLLEKVDDALRRKPIEIVSLAKTAMG